MKIKILVSCPKLLSQSFAEAGGHDAYRTPSRDQISISGNTAAIHNPSGGNIQALYMEGYWHLNPGAKPNNETEAATTTSTEAATTTSTAASEGNCTERGIDPEQLRQGECVENGIHEYVVDRSTELRLPEESIRYEGYRTAKTIHTELGTTTAQGVFVIVKLAVRNNTTEPKRFDADQGATGLLLGKDEYSEDENAENEPEVDSFDWESEPIQPATHSKGRSSTTCRPRWSSSWKPMATSASCNSPTKATGTPPGNGHHPYLPLTLAAQPRTDRTPTLYFMK